MIGLVARGARAVDRYWMAPAPAARLGMVRVLVGGFAVAYFLARLPYWLSHGSMATAQFRPVGVVALALEQPLPAWIVTALSLATVVAAIPFALGWRFRVTGPLFAALCLWTLTYRHSFGMVFHTENLLAWQVLILGVTRAADAWSLDARRAGGPRPEDHGRYGWPLRLMMWIVVIAYVLAGVAKMKNGGMSWMWGDELRHHIAIDNARKMLLGDIYSPLAAPFLHWDWVLRALAAFTVILELGAPVALLGVRAAAVWVVLAVGFHFGVLALMMIVFPYQMLGVAFACFFPVERLGARLEGWYRRRRAGPAGAT